MSADDTNKSQNSFKDEKSNISANMGEKTSDKTNDTKITDEEQNKHSSDNINMDIKKVMDEFDARFNELKKSYDKTIDELKGVIKQKDADIQKQKDMTAQILLNTSSKNTNGDYIDFANTNFNDIDWDKIAGKMMKSIDEKLLN